jgi:hypothetical protein
LIYFIITNTVRPVHPVMDPGRIHRRKDCRCLHIITPAKSAGTNSKSCKRLRIHRENDARNAGEASFVSYTPSGIYSRGAVFIEPITGARNSRKRKAKKRKKNPRSPQSPQRTRETKPSPPGVSAIGSTIATNEASPRNPYIELFRIDTGIRGRGEGMYMTSRLTGFPKSIRSHREQPGKDRLSIATIPSPPNPARGAPLTSRPEICTNRHQR